MSSATPASADQQFLDGLDKQLIEAHGGRLSAISVYDQESSPTTWRLAPMNVAIRGIDFNFGKQPACTFLNDQHPDLRADYVMAKLLSGYLTLEASN